MPLQALEKHIPFRHNARASSVAPHQFGVVVFPSTGDLSHSYERSPNDNYRAHNRAHCSGDLNINPTSNHETKPIHETENNLFSTAQTKTHAHKMHSYDCWEAKSILLSYSPKQRRVRRNVYHQSFLRLRVFYTTFTAFLLRVRFRFASLVISTSTDPPNAASRSSITFLTFPILRLATLSNKLL